MPKNDGDVDHTWLTDILNAVAVSIFPHPVADAGWQQDQASTDFSILSGRNNYDIAIASWVGVAVIALGAAWRVLDRKVTSTRQSELYKITQAWI